MLSLLRHPRSPGDGHELELTAKLPTLAALRRRIAEMRARGWKESRRVYMDAFFGSGADERRATVELRDGILAQPPGHWDECIRKERVGVAPVRGARLRLSRELPAPPPRGEPVLVRRKARSTFTHPDAAGWKVEATMVLQHQPGEERWAQISYELEVELPEGLGATKANGDKLRRFIDVILG